jgi:hypothetical protein
VNQEVAVIAQHPFALFVAFDACGQFAAPLQLVAYFIGDGLILARVGAGADDKIVGETRDTGEVQNFDIGGLLFPGSPHCEEPSGFDLSCINMRTSTVYDVRFDLRQKLAPNRYRTIEVSVYLRFAALVALTIPVLFAQADPTPPAGETPALRADQLDSTVIRARQVLEQVSRLVSTGALPPIRLRKAQEDVLDALDGSILKKSLYSTDLLPEQADQMILIAQRMVLRRQGALYDMEQLVSAGVISRSEAEASGVNLERAQQELEWAQTRAKLVADLAESVRREKAIASMETQAESHPEWVGSVLTKYEGNGIFTPNDLKILETAYLTRFSKPLPISADGETAVHRSLGFDHRGRVDVAVTPDQPEGLWLMRYLESKRIPYYAFRAAVPHQATGAHIHVGPGSTRLALSD